MVNMEKSLLTGLKRGGVMRGGDEGGLWVKEGTKFNKSYKGYTLNRRMEKGIRKK